MAEEGIDFGFLEEVFVVLGVWVVDVSFSYLFDVPKQQLSLQETVSCEVKQLELAIRAIGNWYASNSLEFMHSFKHEPTQPKEDARLVRSTLSIEGARGPEIPERCV